MTVSLPQRWRGLAGGLSLALLVLLAFSAALPNHWIWDDNDYVTDNPALLDGRGLREIWTDPKATPQYYPLVHTSFWLERRLWGVEEWPDGRRMPRPFGHHLDNVLLHALSGVLLWRFLKRLNLPAAWWLAALWSLHPIVVESVAWVTERKNVLSTVFALAAANAFWDWQARNKAAALVAAVAWFSAALLSKTVVASLPAALLLLLWWKRVPLTTRLVVPALLMLVQGGLMGWYTAVLEKEHVRAEGKAWAFDFVDRCLIAGRAAWFYLGKLLWPADLIFIYPRWEIDASDPVAYLYPLAALALLLALLLLMGRGPLAAVLIFGGVLFPALGFLNVYPHQFSFVADHFQHHASIAMVVFLGALLLRLPGFRGGWPARGALLAVLGALSWKQCLIYRDQETLWTDTIERNPRASIAYNNLGCLVYQNVDEYGRPKPRDAARALELFQRAVELNADHTEAWNNRGQVLMETGELEQAEICLKRALELEARYIQPHLNLGVLYGRRNRVAEAIHHLEEANRLNHEVAHRPIPTACAALGSLYLSQGRAAEAEAMLEIGLRAKLPLARIRYDYARALHLQGKIAAALEEYQRAAQTPETAEAAVRAVVWIRAGHADPRFRSAEVAVPLAEQLVSRFGAADAARQDALAAAYAEAGRFDQAAAAAEQAVRLAENAGQLQLAAAVQRRFALYRAGRAFRSPLGIPE